MTRRSFLTNLAGTLAVLVLPAAVKAAAERRCGRYDHLFGKKPWPPNLGVTRWTWTGSEWVPGESRWGDPNPAYLDAVYDELRLTALPRIFA